MREVQPLPQAQAPPACRPSPFCLLGLLSARRPSTFGCNTRLGNWFTAPLLVRESEVCYMLGRTFFGVCAAAKDPRS